MISESFVYWFTRLDHLHQFCGGLSLVLVIIIVTSLILTLIGYVGKSIAISERANGLSKSNTEEEAHFSSLYTTAKKIAVVLSIIVILIDLLTSFIPTTKEMAAIYVVPKIANNENMQEIGSELMDLAKEWLKELHPSKVLDENNNTMSNAVKQVNQELTK